VERLRKTEENIRIARLGTEIRIYVFPVSLRLMECIHLIYCYFPFMILKLIFIIYFFEYKLWFGSLLRIVRNINSVCRKVTFTQFQEQSSNTVCLSECNVLQFLSYSFTFDDTCMYLFSQWTSTDTDITYLSAHIHELLE